MPRVVTVWPASGVVAPVPWISLIGTTAPGVTGGACVAEADGEGDGDAEPDGSGVGVVRPSPAA